MVNNAAKVGKCVLKKFALKSMHFPECEQEHLRHSYNVLLNVASLMTASS